MKCKNCIHYGICGYSTFTDKEIECKDFINKEDCRISNGKWELNKDGSGTCDQCHFTQKNVWDYDNYQQYCGVCGAKMSI